MLLRSRKRKTKQNMHIHEWKDEPLPILKKEKKKNQSNKQTTPNRRSIRNDTKSKREKQHLELKTTSHLT
jgi:hypothetical protein